MCILYYQYFLKQHSPFYDLWACGSHICLCCRKPKIRPGTHQFIWRANQRTSAQFMMILLPSCTQMIPKFIHSPPAETLSLTIWANAPPICHHQRLKTLVYCSLNPAVKTLHRRCSISCLHKTELQSLLPLTVNTCLFIRKTNDTICWNNLW